MQYRLPVAVVLVLCWSAPAQSQNMNLRRLQAAQQQAGAMQGPETTINGTVAGAIRGSLAVLDDKGQRWQVFVPPMAKVQVTGVATADYLRSGLFVEFKADVDEHGTAKEKVGELAIVTLSPERQPGLYPPEVAGEQPIAAVDGVEPDRMGKAGKPAKRPASKGGATSAITAGSYRVVGKLTTGRGGKCAVQTGRGMVMFELTEQPVVTLNVSDYTIATQGAKASIKGVAMPGRAGILRANDVKIELSEPVAGMKKKGPATVRSERSEPKRPAKRAKKDDEELPAEPAVEK
jgi:hypothetical protein